MIFFCSGFLSFFFGPILKQAWSLDNIKDWNIKVPEGASENIRAEKGGHNAKITQRPPSTRSKSTTLSDAVVGLPPECKFNDSNTALSPLCPLCEKSMKTNVNMNQNLPTVYQEDIFTTSFPTFGADWEMVATILGQTGPNGKYFCPFCEVTLSDPCKGSPHSPVRLQRYLLPGVLPHVDYAVRTFESMTEMAVKFQENGARKETAKDYKSCEHVPLIPASGEILDSVSVMPLHISLGTGLQFLNITEKIAI